MKARDLVAEHLSQVEQFATAIRAAADDEQRLSELRRISALLRFMRAFYRTFLAESFGVRVHGFSYPDKRRVARRLIREEDRAFSNRDERFQSTLDLAVRFEDLSDLLHGDMEFGYSDEDEDYEQFHRTAFPLWLNAVERWLRSSGRYRDDNLADAVGAASNDYVAAIESAY